MPRIPRIQSGLSRAGRSASCSPAFVRTPFRAFTTTAPNADLRDKLWKGEAPGPKDPYAPRPAEDIVVENTENVTERPTLSHRQRYIANSPIVVPQVRREALAEQQAEENPMYEPAKTLDDLVEPPSLRDWWEQPGHWGHINQFKGFAPSEKTQSREVVEFYLRRAVAEVLALRQAGKLTESVQGEKWNPPSKTALEADNVTIVVNDGVGSVENGSQIVEELGRKGTHQEWRKFWSWITQEKAQEMMKGWDGSWKDIRLDDELKFGIRKRLFQFTGNYIPDAKLGAVNTVKHLLTFGTVQPKPTKLAEELEQKNLFDELANVRTQDTKIRQIQKETEVGRWKVIEEELDRRGLPATGTKDLPGNKESKRLRGTR